jgi:hypothetical protein
MTFLRDGRFEGKRVALLIMRAGSEPAKPEEIVRSACEKKQASVVLVDSIITDKVSDQDLVANARRFAARVRELAT